MNEWRHGPIMLPDSLVEEVKNEVDIFFPIDSFSFWITVSDPETDTNTVTRGPYVRTKEIWDNVCLYLDSGIEAARS